MQCKQWSKGASKFPASMAMRTKFVAQIMNQFKARGFFSCAGRVSFHAPNIRGANKLTRYKYDCMVRSASPIFKVIAYSFCWSERKRKYVFQWQTAHSKLKKTSIATVPDLCLATVKILTHLISRYQLPLRQSLSAANLIMLRSLNEIVCSWIRIQYDCWSFSFIFMHTRIKNHYLSVNSNLMTSQKYENTSNLSFFSFIAGDTGG
jgi:hypothetical protein